MLYNKNTIVAISDGTKVEYRGNKTPIFNASMINEATTIVVLGNTTVNVVLNQKVNLTALIYVANI